MGFMDDAKQKLTTAVNTHGDKINQGLDRAAAAVDKRTGGKHSAKITQGVARAKQGLDNLDRGATGPAGTTATGRPSASTGGPVTASGSDDGKDAPDTGTGTRRGTHHPAGPDERDTPTEKKEPKAPTGPMGDGTPGGTPGVDR